VRGKSSSLTHHAVTGMMWVAWGSGAMALLKVIVLILLTRLLSPSDFGVVSAALIVIGLSLNFSQLGLGPALVQRPVLEPRHISTAFAASTLLGLAVGSIIWLSAPLIAQFFRMPQLTPVVHWLALVFPITGVATVPDSLLQRDLRFRVLANRDVVSYALGYGAVGIVLALLGWGVWALVGAQVAQAIIRTGILLAASSPVLRVRPDWTSFRELLGYGVGQSAGRMAIIVANQVDNLVVGRWLGAVALGIYSRAFQLMSVPTGLLGDVLDKVLFPTMARVQGDVRRLASAYLRATALLALVTLPVGVVAAVLAPDLVAVAFGPRWQALVAPFQVLVLGMMFRTGSRMSESLSRATGKVYRRAWRQALFAALVFFGALAGHRWGVTGVAFGVLLALLANYLLMAHLSLEVIAVSWTQFMAAQAPALRLTAVVATCTGAVAGLARHFAFASLAVLILGVVAAAGSAGLAVWLFPRLALGEYGMAVRDSVGPHLLARLRPAALRESP